ncbi:putative hydrolase [Alloactinosynnema sp. L-07]|uniref:alpha/beta fold hydrolase n=1 Tax=Alloactinosynnema sp. L-07 TaxID=1653480 RepID=UPI00065F0744|nr:alpha/beta hydrolase [Alloactinosynnema sp. L-07]CRK61764.1 putative hydrolase [Alloactinosynnema sp. L-07]
MADVFRTSDGVGLRLVESGPADAPVTVLFLHGWTSALDVWDHVVAALGPRVRTLRFDHRGHGSSEPAPAGGATLARLAADAAEVIAARVPTGGLVLVGHSMGGMTLMALAEGHPEVAKRASAVVFVSTSSGRMREVTFGLPRPLVRFATRRSVRSSSGGSAASGASAASGGGSVRTGGRKRRVRVKLPPPVRRVGSLAVVRWLVFGTRFRMVDVRATADHAAAVHPKTAAALGRDIGEHDRATALANFEHADVRVLVGELDRLTPLSHARAIAEAAPHAEFVLFPGAGHMLPYERVRELAAHITRAAATVKSAPTSYPQSPEPIHIPDETTPARPTRR